MTKGRNEFVDLIRGVAMLMVVFWHTMTGSTKGYEYSLLTNIIWSLQMPLFILISGYVTRYSKELKTIGELLKFFLKRTTAYLLPFAIWSFLIRGLILGQSNFLNIKYMLWHTDSGYWFLITIWTISVIFGIANFVSSKIKNTILGKQALLLLVYICGMAVLGIIGYFVGMSFLGIKLTLYYMPLYFSGYVYGQYRDRIFSLSFGKRTVDIIVAVCLAVWIFSLTRFNLFTLADGGKNIIIRAAVSLFGCIAVCGLLKGAFSKTERGGALLCLAGAHSIEIYLVHYLFLNLVKTANSTPVFSIKGMFLTILNFAITLFATMVTIMLTNSNRTLHFCLYGKKK